ncbi:L,D-transpeptidase family protein [Halonatronum saccharophilum]|uniref:L,D-transpeptidase family protein n=1 Tax=Halonatronum saccharophilum TaxID=150060 RepID=UPI000485F68E|nr:L,D-transpeptidase family protein [Halonatronum saccharophilum]
MMKRIVIILNERRLYLYEGDKMLRSFPVAIGKADAPTPTGTFHIINMTKNPYNKALGTRWMQFTHRMHGIHGTNAPWSIGKAVSKGCVRMYNHDAEYLYDQVQVGTEIKIKSNSTKRDKDYENFKYYTIQPGDTLYKIAKRFNTTIEEIIKINRISNKNLIHPGQKIKIPY